MQDDAQMPSAALQTAYRPASALLLRGLEATDHSACEALRLPFDVFSK